MSDYAEMAAIVRQREADLLSWEQFKNQQRIAAYRERSGLLASTAEFHRRVVTGIRKRAYMLTLERLRYMQRKIAAIAA